LVGTYRNEKPQFSCGLDDCRLGREVTVDQRVSELPLRAGDLEAVALQRRLAGAALAELLPLGDEMGNLRRELVCARGRTTPPETHGPQVPQ
jgi:hypothetical protein